MSIEDSHNSLLDLDAEYYAEHSSTQTDLINEILDTYTLNPYAHILDVGCGDGKITANLANQVTNGKVLGIDASSSMIEYAIKNFPKKDFPNLDFLHKTAEESTFPKQFDLIVSFFCFHWLKKPELAIKQLSNALKPNGEMLVLTCPQESPYYQYMQAALQKYPKYYPLSANHNMCSAKKYKDLISNNGLEIVEFQQRKSYVMHNTLDEMQEFIKGWLNSYISLPHDLQSTFINDISQLVHDDPSTHRNKQFAIPYTVLIIKAKKI